MDFGIREVIALTMDWRRISLEEAVEILIEYFQNFSLDEISPLIEFLNTLSFEELMEIFRKEKHIIVRLIMNTERLEETPEVMKTIYEVVSQRYFEIKEKILEIINERMQKNNHSISI